ncbi:MAG: hypothetical protein RLY16_2113 [Bacteroidota bacterium]|jgi:sugar O-acyltransferase (sialic acid O-acetyltransferase NeuD family)
MEKIIVVGAGGHSAEIDDYFDYTQRKHPGFASKIVGFLDDNPDSYKGYQFSAPFLGSIRDHVVDPSCKYLIGIANVKYRKPIVERLMEKGATFAGFIHPDTYISRTAQVGVGVIVAPGVNLGPNVKVGDFTLINSRSSVAHDTILGKYNFVCPNVCFSGFTQVGDENLFGINSATIPGVVIGNKNKIAAGMTLDKPVGDEEVVFYRFKEKVIAVPRS